MGRVKFLREKGRSNTEIQRLHGLTFLTVAFYEREGLSPRAVERRLRQLERTFQRGGVSRVILPPEFPYACRLRAIKPVDTLGFYRGAADLLVLGLLEKRQINPAVARVALTGPRLCPELKEAARHLYRNVRELRIDVPGEDGALFSQLLQRNWGIPVIPRTMPVDVTVSFGPSEKRADLSLWGELPDLGGQRLTAAGLDLPAELEQPVLALLWEQGRVKREQLQVGIAPQTLANGRKS